MATVVTQLATVNGEVEQGVKDFACQKRRRDAEGHPRHHHRSGDLALSSSTSGGAQGGGEHHRFLTLFHATPILSMLKCRIQDGDTVPGAITVSPPWAEAPFPIKHELEKVVNGGHACNDPV